jgi:hypothetical protein
LLLGQLLFGPLLTTGLFIGYAYIDLKSLIRRWSAPLGLFFGADMPFIIPHLPPPGWTADPAASHEDNVFYARLQKARDESPDYDSLSFREAVSTKFESLDDSRPGMYPYPWQLDVAESLYLGLDTTVIAPTGSGKTIPFVLPILFGTKLRGHIVMIISPLKDLQRDMARRMRHWKLRTCVVNGETWTARLLEVCRVCSAPVEALNLGNSCSDWVSTMLS